MSAKKECVEAMSKAVQPEWRWTLRACPFLFHDLMVKRWVMEADVSETIRQGVRPHFSVDFDPHWLLSLDQDCDGD